MAHAVELTPALMKCSLRVCELVFFLYLSSICNSIVHIDFHPTCTFGSSSIADSWLKNAEDIHESTLQILRVKSVYSSVFEGSFGK